MEYILKTKETFEHSVWSGGKTTQLFISPDNGIYKTGEFDLRISSATIEAEESIFTKLNGYNRFICTLDHAITIQHNSQAPINLQPLCLHSFSGEDETRSIGLCTDFNVIYKENLSVSCWIAKGIIKLQKQKNYVIYFVTDSNLEIDNKTVSILKNSCLIVKQLENDHLINPLQSHQVIVVEY